MNDIKFRQAEESDIEDVFKIFKTAIDKMIEEKIFQWDEIYPDKNILSEDIANKQLYIGYDDNQIVSVYVINDECDEQYRNGDWHYRNASYNVIHRLCVNPGVQNRGIGRKTMNHIEKEVKEKGIECIRLDAFTLNPAAVKLYENLGYSKTGFADWRKGRFYLMEKRL